MSEERPHSSLPSSANLKKLLLIDAYSVYYRAYYAFSNNPLKNSKGKETSVIFGFFNTLYSLITHRDFDFILIALDSKTETFRHKQYPAYKANRPPMPDSLREQVDYTVDLLVGLGLPHWQVPGYEADDLMGTAARKAEKEGVASEIFTSDKDLAQVVNDRIHLLHSPRKGDDFFTEGPGEILDKWGVKPNQMIDLLTLIGDTADNVPGVKGIGKKTASAILNQFPSIEVVYENIEDIPSKTTRKKLEASRKEAFLSKRLITLDLEVSDPPALEDMTFQPVNQEAILDALKERELFSIIKKFNLESAKSTFYLNDFKSRKKKSLSSSETSFSPFRRRGLRVEELEMIHQKAMQSGSMTFDLETTSLDPFIARLVAVVFAFPDQSSFYLRLLTSDRDLYAKALPALKAIFEEKTIKKIGHNLKFEFSILNQCGIRLRGIFFDTMLAEYVLNPNRTHYNLENLAMSYFAYHKKAYREMLGDHVDILSVPEKDLQDYTMEDGEFTQRLFEAQLKQLDPRQKKLLFDLEMLLIPVLGTMETNGVMIDTGILKRLSDQSALEIDAITRQIHDLAGEKFNIRSTKAVQAILFERLGIKPLKKTKMGYSTDISVLEKLASRHPIAQALVRYRMFTKLKSTYLDSLPRLIHPQTGRIHTNYNQSVAATGRLSSTHPNLQNIPVKMEEGRNIRDAFIAPKKCVIASFDYSQVELRVLAKLSGDRSLLDAYTKNLDIHHHTARLLFGMEEINPDQRRMAKTINFSVVYGISPYALAEDLKISPKEAAAFIEGYFAAYPGVKQYITDVVELARKKKYVRTYYQRKRPVPDILSANHNIRSHAERVAFNSVIQGTASDIIKVAMIRVHQGLGKGELEGEMVMQVHDELIFYLPEKKLEEQTSRICQWMKAVEPFSDVLEVNVKTGKNWNT